MTFNAIIEFVKLELRQIIFMKNDDFWGKNQKSNYCGVSNKRMEVAFFQQINRRGVTSIRYPRVHFNEYVSLFFFLKD